MDKEKKKFPIGKNHYTLYEEVGEGVSASVYRALCIPNNEIVAIKILDFERCNSDLVISFIFMSSTFAIYGVHNIFLDPVSF